MRKLDGYQVNALILSVFLGLILSSFLLMYEKIVIRDDFAVYYSEEEVPSTIDYFSLLTHVESD